MDQVDVHLEQELLPHYGTTTTHYDFYDHSSGHRVMPEDALNVTKLNIGPGWARKDQALLRKGYFRCQRSDGSQEKRDQSMVFEIGDCLHIAIKNNLEIKLHVKTKRAYPRGHVVTELDDDLIGAKKGAHQILMERGITDFVTAGTRCKRSARKLAHNNNVRRARKRFLDSQLSDFAAVNEILELDNVDIDCELDQIQCKCAKCVLSDQEDFIIGRTKSEIEERYERFNAKHNTHFFPLFLPKFHPELNPIERMWSNMKNYVKQNLHICDGSLDELEQLMKEGMERIPVSTARRYFQRVWAYFEAYRNGHPLIEAEAWVKQRRSHRGYAKTMDQLMGDSPLCAFFEIDWASSPTSPSSLSQTTDQHVEIVAGPDIIDLEAIEDDISFDILIPDDVCTPTPSVTQQPDGGNDGIVQMVDSPIHRVAAMMASPKLQHDKWGRVLPPAPDSPPSSMDVAASTYTRDDDEPFDDEMPSSCCPLEKMDAQDADVDVEEEGEEEDGGAKKEKDQAQKEGVEETRNPVSSLEQAMEEFDEDDLLMNVLCKVLERSKFV